jgi:hypothetical protein
MRSLGKSTIRSRAAKAHAVQTLTQALPLKKPGHKCTSTVIYQVVLFAAVWNTSITAACEELHNGDLSDQAARDALRRGLPKRIADLEKRLNEAINLRLPRGVFRRSRVIAIDLHLDPYYGEPLKNKNELYRSQPKQGTSDYHAYATVTIVEKGHRYTLGFTQVKAKEKMAAVVSRLLVLVAARGVRIRRVLLDRGFFCFDVIELLATRKLSWIMPVMIRGRAPKDPKKATGFRVLMQKKSGWYEYEMTKNSKSLKFDVCVARKLIVPKDGRRKRYMKPMLFASVGAKGSPREIREQYRKRFGIETSYRQLRQAWATTTTRDPWLRLVLFGVAVLLLNVWVWLQSRSQSGAGGSREKSSPTVSTFERLLRDIAYELRKEHDPDVSQVPTGKPVAMRC